MIREYEKWKMRGAPIRKVGIEDKNEGTALFQRLVISPDARLPLDAVTPEGDKEWRAIPLANAIEAGRFHVPIYPSGESVSVGAKPGARAEGVPDRQARRPGRCLLLCLCADGQDRSAHPHPPE